MADGTAPKTVLVTGCSKGIGRATAVELAQRGHAVAATARIVSTLDDLDAKWRLPLDVTDQASVDAAVAEIGDVDALVNNAGITLRSPVESVPLDAFGELLATNVVGPLRMVQAVLPGMRRKGGGVVVNLSSVFGRISWPLMGPYSATKYALEGLSEALHFEVGHFGVDVVVVEPGYVAPGMEGATYGEDPPYDELYETVAETFEAGSGGDGLPGAEVVAGAIADAIEGAAEATPLRVPVGDQAQLALGARSALDDNAFETALRDLFGFRW